MHGLVALTVEVQTGRLCDVLQGGVFEAGIVVVAAVAYLERAVADVGLLLEEGVEQVLFAAQLLVALQLESVRSPCTAPSAAHLEVGVLVEHHHTVLVQIGEVDGALPVHVPVALRRLSVARTAVGALLEDTYLAAVEEVGVGDHR